MATRIDPDTIQGEAVAALRAVALDDTAPAAARASAARTLAEIAGAIGRHAEKPNANRDLADMTEDELREAANG